MPRNRRPVSRQQKRDELLVAAAELFLEEGYEGASVGRIAARAGVTPNTLYWYFADKDELLVAVAELYLQALLSEHANVAERPLAEQLAWVVDRLRPVKHLVATVHHRIALAESVRGWHEHFHRSLEDLFEGQLPGPIPDGRRAAEAAAAAFALEGAVNHDLDQETTRQLCEIVAQRLLRAAATADDPASSRRGHKLRAPGMTDRRAPAAG